MCTRLESMLSTFTSVVRNFRVSLPNHYDPDQIAAYFDQRPHVLIFRLLEVFAAFGSVALQSRARKAALLCKNGRNISEEENSQLTMHTAEALKQTFLRLGITFIKVAQSLSARPDIIDTEAAKVLAELQDRLPHFHLMRQLP
jgi:aarF domain-containing kinase